MGNSTTRLISGSVAPGVTTTATAAGTTTLTVSSTQLQIFTGSSTQIIKLPVATTLASGQQFEIYNESTGALTLQFQDASSFTDASSVSYSTVPSKQAIIIKLQTNGTANGTWAVFMGAASSTGFTLFNPTIQKFSSGSGTYTTPSNVAYIRVKVIGGGGGGGGSGSAGGGTGGTGGTTSFGTSLLSGNGGVGGAWNGAGGTGGAASLGTGPIGTTYTGNTGYDGNQYFSAGTVNLLGGATVYTPMGAFGAGGKGGHNNVTVNTIAGSSGGAGGYVDAIISSPNTSYSYSIGAAGTSGTAGTSGVTGATGAPGYIEVTEYYYNNPSFGVTVTASSAPTVQKFTSSSGTYATPAGVQWIRVRMVGGGGGGSSGGPSYTTFGQAGGNSTFGSSLLTANGGGGGSNSSGGTGGTASLGAAIGSAITGGTGNGSGYTNTAQGASSGGGGASTPFGGAGGAGGGSGTAQVGSAAVTNTGSGGGGASVSNAASGSAGGCGGGAAGYVDAIITNPSSTYAYAIGAAGSGGTGTTSGGAGGSGYIEVTEYYTAFATGGFTGGGANVPTVQKFTTGSGTYTTPSNILYIKIRMVGPGGGGGGGGTASNHDGSAGSGATTFGTSLLSAGAGGGGTAQGVGGAGGTASLGTGPIGTALIGGIGQTGSLTTISAGSLTGGAGGQTVFGGAGAGANNGNGVAAQTASANTGAGGGGGAPTSTTLGYCGAGGGSGGYVDAIIFNPLTSYSYSIGTGGGGGAAGTNGIAGSNGAAGYIEVIEFYANGTVGTATNVTGIVAQANGGTGQTLLPGNYYASVYYPNSNSNYWQVSSTSYADFTVTGTIPSPSTYVNSNFGTISKATSSFPGINFSAPKSGVIKITINCGVYGGAAAGNANWSLKLLESTTSTVIGEATGGLTNNSASALEVPTTIVGYFPVTASTTYNFKLQGAISTNTLYVMAISPAVAGSSGLTVAMNYIT